MARPKDLALLWALYFVQGLPFGFQATALPVMLRERGASLTLVGLAGLLAAPWLCKPLWAPLVDRYHAARIGRRKSWLVPMQLGLASSALGAALVAASAAESPRGIGSLGGLMAIVLVMNLFAATLDIAVDGLAVDVLRGADLGHGNTAQVVGYKLGMLSGGGLLLWATPRLGEGGVFVAMACLVFAVCLVTFTYREMPAPRAAGKPPTDLRQVLGTLRRALAAPGGGVLLLSVATYKLGESVADGMFKPFVLDAGFAKEQIGLWIGTYGMLFSVLGSVVGGILATRLSFVGAVGVAAALRLVPLTGELWMSLQPQITQNQIINVSCAEHFCGGALTTAMFALMMSRTDPRIGATHFTVLAAVEVLGKMPPALGAGALAERVGYAPVFAGAVVLSLLFLPLWWLLRQSLALTAESASPDPP